MAGASWDALSRPQMVASMEDSIAHRIRNQADPALTGQPTTTPRGWAHGTKTGWGGAARPPGIMHKPRFKNKWTDGLKNRPRPDIKIRVRRGITF